jgi:putative hydrolase of the HAD superfamily
MDYAILLFISGLSQRFDLDIKSAVKYALPDMRKIQAIIFDWGGVLIEDPAPALFKYCANALGVGVEKYAAAFNMFLNDFQTGRVIEQQFWRNMTSYLKVPMPKVNSLWSDAFALAYRPRQELFSLAGQLRKAGLKIALLSNTEKPAVELIRRQKYDLFDVMVFSCHEGTAKPERKIYEIVLDRLGIPAGNTLFIDDKQDFIDGAKKVGLQTIFFKNIDQLKKNLAELGLNLV